MVEKDLTAIAIYATQNQSYSVKEIRKNFKNYFPDAKCAAAMDADQNGIIDYADAELVLQAYASSMVGKDPNSNVGKIDIFELFD